MTYEVFLIPPDTPQLVLERLYDRLWEATIQSVPELEFTTNRPQDITILFPKDLMLKGIGDYFKVRVTELALELEHSPEIKLRLGEALKNVILEFFPKAKYIEINVNEASLEEITIVHDID